MHYYHLAFLTFTLLRPGATPLNSSVRPGMNPAEVAKANLIQEKLVELGADSNFEEGGIMMVPSGFRESVFGYADLLMRLACKL